MGRSAVTQPTLLAGRHLSCLQPTPVIGRLAMFVGWFRMAQLPRTLQARLHILKCPGCGSSLSERAESLVCVVCTADYPVRNRKIYFVTPPAHETQASDIKHWLRQHLGAHYKRAVRILGPGLPLKKRQLLLENIDPSRSIVVDLGSGTERVHADVVTCDLFDYREVDIVCDLRTMPFAEGQVDMFMTSSVIEHVEDVPALVGSMFASTRPGGIGIHSFPFLFPFHESPHDYIRFTHMGAAVLFREWKIRRLFNSAGPVTLFNTVAIECLSSMLSFNNGRLKEAIYLALCALFFPLKYLDKLFVDRPRFLACSAILCVIVERP
jgi:SAM-dependent methyltransferase